MTLRRLRRFIGLSISSPVTGWLLVRMLAWTYSLHALKLVLPFRTLLRIVRPRERRQFDPAQRIRIEFLLRRLSNDGDCLERSLVAYRFLLLAGAKPTLYLGFDRDPPRRHGHAWVTVEGEPLLESAESLSQFAPVAVIEA